MHGSACTIRIGTIQCIEVIGSTMCSTNNIVINSMQHRTSTAAGAGGAIKATEAVPRAAVRGTAAVVMTIIDAEAEMWAKLLVAIIALKTVLQTSASGIITPRMSRTVAIIGTARSRQCDHRALYMTFYNDCQAVIVRENAPHAYMRTRMSMIVTMIISQTRIGPTAAHIDR